jgi:perosamine synthetase
MNKSAKKTGKSDLALHGGRPVRARMPEQRAITGDEEIRAVTRVLRSGRLTALSNPVVGELERRFAEYCGAKYAVAVNSGTAALHVALAALGVGPGDEAIVPPYTFIATASAVLQQNAVPIFADIDPETLNLDPTDFEKKITPRTKAVIPVHLFGLPADMDAINRIARRHGIAVVEDACQSHGAIYKGEKTGTLGKIACFSFQESKNMMSGEGGMIVTNDKTLHKTCHIIKHIGMKGRYEYATLGYNYRLPATAAAIGIEQLKKLDGFNTHRRMMADYYRENLAGLPLKMIDEPAGLKSANHLFPILLPAGSERGTREILKALTAENVLAWWVYPMPLYKVKFLRELDAYPKSCPFGCELRGDSYSYAGKKCPAAEDVTMRTLVLPTAPCHPLSVAHDTVRGLRKVLSYYFG